MLDFMLLLGLSQTFYLTFESKSVKFIEECLYYIEENFTNKK